LKELNILIIDDNHDLADGLGMVLEDENHQVSSAYSGYDGIKLFDAGQFDVVFLDVKLPDINGVEVFHNIHKKKPTSRVIMMTGYRVEQLLAEVVDDGDVEILRKPFEIGYVLEILGRIKKESIVLIADDDPDFSEGLSDYLNDHGMKTIRAKNGQEAVEGVLSNPVDVLVLDLRLPIMCGLEVYLELKQRGSSVKTIIVTGYASEEAETVDILKSASVTGCLFKPFDPED
jgi:DNA-binding response OmpR family regulator